MNIIEEDKFRATEKKVWIIELIQNTSICLNSFGFKEEVERISELIELSL